MSAENFSQRLPQNTPGKYYVDEQCTDCDLCRETAPKLFERDATEGVSYIAKQPETAEEIELAKESLEGCPCEAIFDDGDQFDWSTPRDPNGELTATQSPLALIAKRLSHGGNSGLSSFEVKNKPPLVPLRSRLALDGVSQRLF